MIAKLKPFGINIILIYDHSLSRLLYHKDTSGSIVSYFAKPQIDVCKVPYNI